MQVYVAGATGNTGKRVVQQLSAKGIKVLAGTRVSPLHQPPPMALSSNFHLSQDLQPGDESSHPPRVAILVMYAVDYRDPVRTCLLDQLFETGSDAGSQKGGRSWLG